MNGMEVKKIHIVFENCEYVEIPVNVVAGFSITGIKTKIERIGLNCIAEMEIAKHVFMEIFPEANKLGRLYPDAKRSNIIERITTYNDITSITLIYDDGHERTVYVDYDDDGEDYLGAPNKNQMTYLHPKSGILYISVSGKYGISDYVDNEYINSPDYANDMRMLLNIGSGDECEGGE